ncbi:potassium channel subfamily T member 2-like isoform X3 [Folsomia candida]|uniref:potassium channel subfamily T member 2-like isoform X3 n=1 Tax=Folsomia candida TaxID=158441 RepID=UPI001604B638|nr:potassium channel subfamily T member 2-like isoform X3 [Folsomia candida]
MPEYSVTSSTEYLDELEPEKVRVEYYVNENTIKERLHLYFIKNQRSSLRIRIARMILKLFTCILYVGRVVMDTDPLSASCYGCHVVNNTMYLEAIKQTEERFQDNQMINWSAIMWVQRPVYIWILHIILAVISLSETILITYLGYKNNLWQQICSRHFILELMTTVPFLVTIFHPPLRHMFIPVFLNSWLAKYALENTFNDLHRAMQRNQSALSQQLTVLTATLICLVFTSVCGIQHFQRAGQKRMSLFQAVYFVVVTFSTVGYGDYVPDIWPSQLFMVAMICIALIVLPTQFEQLAFTWMERQKLGGTYSAHRASNDHHVVVCSTTLHADTIMDFLNEFFSHPMLQDYCVVLLSPMELDTTMRMILQVPIWAQRVIYIQGSCLKDGDLIRARMSEAEACFILAARNYSDKTAADEHTILRAWAVKDYAPGVPQYIQIFRPENKIHVRFAEHVVCEDEFKYALLANNCLFPGTSTLVTLLLHTSRGREGQTSREEWHRLYGRCSGNEIYHIRLDESRFFGEYEGKSFTYASFHAHRKYGVSLVGVRPSLLPEFYEDTILLNPGRHVMRKSDICFYFSITKEENSDFDDNQATQPGTGEPAAVSSLAPAGSGGPTNDKGGEDKVTINCTASTPLLGEKTEGFSSLMNPTGLSPGHHMGGSSSLGRGEGSGGSNLNIASLATPTGGPREGPCGSPGIAMQYLNQMGKPMESNLLLPPNLMRRESRRPSILPVPESYSSSMDEFATEERHSDDEEMDSDAEEAEDEVPWLGHGDKTSIVKGFPPVSPYIGVTPTLCYLLKEKKPLCCLQLCQACDHCVHRNAYDYNWQNSSIILTADFASAAIYNFIVPLRAHFRPKSRLNPIILLLERRPDSAFLDAISHFPMIYWMLGSIDCLDDLLRAGITLAESVVVVNKELSNSAEEDSLSDCNTIVAVQTMFRFFPHIKIVTELSTSSNMRFMQFRASDAYALHLSKMEKKEKERGSHISYMFRLPFAAGSVFSASMLDTLLYQAFVKDYLITFVRLLLGIDQAPGSGFLTSLEITHNDLWIRTYGRLYQKLCSTSCEIPFGIYRTQDTSSDDSPEGHTQSEQSSPVLDPGPTDIEGGSGGGGDESIGKAPSKSFMPQINIPNSCLGGCSTQRSSYLSVAVHDDTNTKDSHTTLIERAEIASLIRSRMQSLGLPNFGDTVFHFSERRSSLSYVIINPSCDLKLKEGDVVYLIKPTPFSAQKTFERHNSRRKSTLSCVSGIGGGNGGDGQPLGFNLFTQPSPDPSKRRRSSSGSLLLSGQHCSPRVPVTKSNSLSLPDSPDARPRSNSLRVGNLDDILMRRSSSLRQGLLSCGPSTSGRRSSNEELGIPQTTITRPVRLTLNGGIGLEVTVTPPDDSITASAPSLPLQGYQGTMV